MAYKYTKGKTFQGDIYNEDDTQKNTYLDWSEDALGIVTGGSTTLVVSASAVGIGTATPDYTLDVAGDIGIDQYIYHNGDDDTFIRFQDDDITIKAGNVNFINFASGSQNKLIINDSRDDLDFIVRSPSEPLAVYLNAANEVFHINHGESNFKTKIHSLNGEALTVNNAGVILNEDGAGANDFRVESTGNTHMLFVDAGSNEVGIGTSTPAYTLDVSGNIGVNEFIVHNGDPDTFLRFETNTIGITAGNANVMRIEASAITVNPEKAAMISFKVHDDQGESILAIASNAGPGASGGAVGIHNEDPAYDFVVGDDVLIVSGSSVGVGSTWSGKEFHVTDGDSGTPSAPADSQVVVESGGNAGISLLAGGTRARIFFGDSSDIDEGIIEYKFTNTERFNIDVAGNEVMRIYESGASNTITTLNGVKTTAGLFTEGHPYYSNDENITVGDCCVLENGQIVRSSSPMQKNVGGIAWYSVLDDLQNSGSSGDEAWSLTLDDATVSRVAEDALGVQCNMAEESGGEWVPTAKFQTLWKLAAVGDSRQSNYGTTALTGFKVCNEGGEVSAGDLLCTSTTPGFLMKQSDDIMRSYTVGKSMENVTFDSNGQAVGIYGYLYCG